MQKKSSSFEQFFSFFSSVGELLELSIFCADEIIEGSKLNPSTEAWNDSVGPQKKIFVTLSHVQILNQKIEHFR